MKALLLLLLAVPCLASPLWVEKGAAETRGLWRKGPVPMTGSMRPAIHGGEFLYVEVYRKGVPLKVGDVVEAIRSDGVGVLHRITAMNKRAVYLSGDANRFSDGWVLLKDVKTVVRYIERKPVSHLAQVR